MLVKMGADVIVSILMIQNFNVIKVNYVKINRKGLATLFLVGKYSK